MQPPIAYRTDARTPHTTKLRRETRSTSFLMYCVRTSFAAAVTAEGRYAKTQNMAGLWFPATVDASLNLLWSVFCTKALGDLIRHALMFDF